MENLKDKLKQKRKRKLISSTSDVTQVYIKLNVVIPIVKYLLNMSTECLNLS